MTEVASSAGWQCQVFERYYNELLRFLSRRLGGDPDAAADVAQETFARAWAMQQSMETPAARGQCIEMPRALLYRIARNLVVDRHRQAQRGAESLDAEEVEMMAPEHVQPEVIHASRQRTAALLAEIEALPPRCREAFVLHKFDGLSHADIAERMGISRNMVEKHVIRGMLACRRCMDRLDCNEGEPSCRGGDA